MIRSSVSFEESRIEFFNARRNPRTLVRGFFIVDSSGGHKTRRVL